MINLDYIILRLKNGFRKLSDTVMGTIAIFVYPLIVSVVSSQVIQYYVQQPFASREMAEFVYFSTLIWGIILGIIIVFLIGGNPKELRVNNLMRKTKLRNKHDESPLLMDYKEDDGVITMEFFSEGIPIDKWLDEKTSIESALNMEIVKIAPKKGKMTIEVVGVSANNSLPNMIYWDPSCISNKDDIINLGVGFCGVVSMSLNKIPHILIGGSTGSGKSILLKTIIFQRLLRNDVVYIADFKGGVDYNGYLKKRSVFVTDIDVLLKVLEDVKTELYSRMRLFEEYECPNIVAYRNQHSSEDMPRIVVAFDEIAEVLDKTGCSSEVKKQIQKVEVYLSIIARLGRAFGIHLVLSTQRPDANILNGQIRNNIDMRICGRADDVLSKIILDNTSASDAIPKYEQGLFITNDGTIFRGYYFNDNEVE